jgi:cobalt-zinc-cadmium efflux system membrane fusion protein
MNVRDFTWKIVLLCLLASIAACGSNDERHEAAPNQSAARDDDHSASGHDDHAASDHDDHGSPEHDDQAASDHDDHGTSEDEHADHSHDESGPAGHDDAAHDLRVELSPDAITGGGIEVTPAGPWTMHIGLDLPGEVVLNADRLAHVVPRFPGIAKEVKKALGDRVSADEVLAVIESNESLARYDVRSMISGVVTEKHITLGEFVRDDEDIFVVADLSTVWVNITVYARDIGRVRRGQTVDISVVGGGPRATAQIDYIAPALGQESRAATARAVLPNPNLEWRQGMFVNARVVLEEPTVPVAVLDSAIQRIEGRETVFVQEEPGVFEGRLVSLGRSDGEWTEILSGVEAGEQYVSAGSFLLKSELMKSEAGHEH